MELNQLLADIRSRLAQLNIEIVDEHVAEFHNIMELGDNIEILVSLEHLSITHMNHNIIECMSECDDIDHLFSLHFKSKEV